MEEMNTQGIILWVSQNEDGGSRATRLRSLLQEKGYTIKEVRFVTDSWAHAKSLGLNGKLEDHVRAFMKDYRRGDLVYKDGDTDVFTRVLLCAAKRGKVSQVAYSDKTPQACLVHELDQTNL